MAEPAPEDDPFDLDSSPSSVLSVAPTAPAPPKAPERPLPPRAPDGTFVKVEEPKHPAHLVNQAREFGMEDETIAEMSTPTLYRTINMLLLRDREMAKSFATQRDLDGARVAQPAPAVSPAPEVDELDVLEKDGFDPRLIKALKEARGPKEELKALKAAMAEREQRDVQREFQGGVAIVDAAFAKLANPLLGDGSGADLVKDPAKKAAFQRRVAILNAAGITDMRQVDRHTIMKKIREANELLFGAVATSTEGDIYSQALAQGKTNGRISREEWEAGAVARPSARNGAPEPKGEALAIRNLTAKLRDQESQRGDEDELDGIPD